MLKEKLVYDKPKGDSASESQYLVPTPVKVEIPITHFTNRANIPLIKELINNEFKEPQSVEGGDIPNESLQDKLVKTLKANGLEDKSIEQITTYIEKNAVKIPLLDTTEGAGGLGIKIERQENPNNLIIVTIRRSDGSDFRLDKSPYSLKRLTFISNTSNPPNTRSAENKQLSEEFFTNFQATNAIIILLKSKFPQIEAQELLKYLSGDLKDGELDLTEVNKVQNSNALGKNNSGSKEIDFDEIQNLINKPKNNSDTGDYVNRLNTLSQKLNSLEAEEVYHAVQLLGRDARLRFRDFIKWIERHTDDKQGSTESKSNDTNNLFDLEVESRDRFLNTVRMLVEDQNKENSKTFDASKIFLPFDYSGFVRNQDKITDTEVPGIFKLYLKSSVKETRDLGHIFNQAIDFLEQITTNDTKRYIETFYEMQKLRVPDDLIFSCLNDEIPNVEGIQRLRSLMNGEFLNKGVFTEDDRSKIILVLTGKQIRQTPNKTVRKIN